MNSYRLIINNYDESSVTATEASSGAIGYTVVRSPKGPDYPVLIKNVSQLHKIFGSPSKDYPELFEAETFIANGHQAYICSSGAALNSEGKEETSSKIPYIVVCDEGNFRAVDLIDYTDSIKEFAELGDASGDCSALATTASTSINVYGNTKVVEGAVRFNAASKCLIFPMHNVATKNRTDGDTTQIGDTEATNNKLDSVFNGKQYILSSGTYGDIKITISGADVIEEASKAYIGSVKFFNPTNNASIDSISGTAEEASYKVGLVITGSEESDKSAALTKVMVENITKSSLLVNGFSLIEAKTIDSSTIRALVIPKHVNSTEMTIAFSSPEYTGSSTEKYRNKDIRNTLYLAVSSPEYTGADNITGTLDETSTSELFFNDVINSSYSQELIAIYRVKKWSAALSTSYSSGNIERTITLPAGIKKSSSANTISSAWACAQDNEYEDVDVFFDSFIHRVRRDAETKEVMNEAPSEGFMALSATSPLCNFIYSRTVPKDLIEDADTCNCGNTFYTICGLKKVTYVNSNGVASSFESPCVGAYASMICDIIDSAYGGVAPMFLNSNGLGGQLNFPVGSVSSKMVYNYSSDNQKALEKKNYNPIIFDSTYGTMVTAQRTNATGVLTDWSYIGHVCSFLTFQREVRTNVMIPQLGKANNPYYRELRAEQVSQILRPRLEGSNAIWEAATVDTSTNTGANDEAAQKAKKFIINVRVKPSPFSEYVVLNFTNYNDSSSSEATTV